jgi:ABC-type lipopolysaccharide export system ATPase subunit
MPMKWFNRVEQKIKHLSGGELRYLEIKLILNNSSKFVLLDEPYNGLSPIMIEKINELITACPCKGNYYNGS